MCIYTITRIYFVLFVKMFQEALPSVTVIDKGIFPVEKGSIGIQFFVDVKNDHHWKSCRLHSWPKTCCFDSKLYKDYCTDAIYGDNMDFVMAKRRDTLVFVYPTLYQHDQVGQCDFLINVQCGQKTGYKQIDVTIEFDTSVNIKKPPSYLQSYKGLKRSVCTSLDEDSLNDCTPVDCDLKYSGRKPFFDITRNKCVSAPACLTDFTKDIPDIVYVPKINICRDLDQSIMLADIYAISTGIGVVTEAVDYEPSQWQVQVVTNCSTISENLKLLRDLVTGKLCPMFYGNSTVYSDCCVHALLSVCACVVAITAVLMSTICCIHITVCLYKKTSKKDLKDALRNFKQKLKTDNIISRPSRLSREVTNNLLKEVIVRDLPIELKESMVDICDRISKEVGTKKRYRMTDLSNHVNFEESDSESTGSSSARSKHSDMYN